MVSRYQASGTERRYLDNGNVGRPEPIKFFRATWPPVFRGRSSKWPRFSQSAGFLAVDYFSEKVSFFAVKDSLSLSLSLYFGVEDRKEEEKKTKERRRRIERERDRESSLMLYRAVRPTGFGPLSRFWNPSIDPLARDIRFLLASISSFCSPRYDGYETWQRDRSSAWQF